MENNYILARLVMVLGKAASTRIEWFETFEQASKEMQKEYSDWLPEKCEAEIDMAHGSARISNDPFYRHWKIIKSGEPGNLYI